MLLIETGIANRYRLASLVPVDQVLLISALMAYIYYFVQVCIMVFIGPFLVWPGTLSGYLTDFMDRWHNGA